MIFTKLLRSLVCLGLIFILGGCGPDEGSSAPDPKALEIQNAARLRRLTTDLGLTAEQQAGIKILLTGESQEIAKIHEEATRTGGDRVLRIQSARKITYEKMKPLLTPAQTEKFDGVVKKIETRKR